MAKEVISAVVYAEEREQGGDAWTTIRTEKVCAGGRIHFVIRSVLEDCYEYEDVIGYGPCTSAEYQQLVHANYHFGPCDGSCQTEMSAQGKTVRLPWEVSQEVPEKPEVWQRTVWYYRRW